MTQFKDAKAKHIEQKEKVPKRQITKLILLKNISYNYKLTWKNAR
jgi:hypothetical protein